MAGFAAAVAALFAVYCGLLFAMLAAGLVNGGLRSALLEAPVVCGAIIAAGLPGYAVLRSAMSRIGTEGRSAFAAGGAINGVVVLILFVAVDPFQVRYGLTTPMTGLSELAMIFGALGALAGLAAWFGERWMRQRIVRAEMARGS